MTDAELGDQATSGKHSLSSTDQILDLLLDALSERQQARQTQNEGAAPRSAPQLQPVPPKEPAAPAVASVPAARPDPQPSEQRRPVTRPPARAFPAPAPQPGEEGWQPPARLPNINMGKMLGRLAILIVMLIVAVNIPVTRYGVSLARILPEASSLIVSDGLVLKGSGPEIYVLEEDKLHWISSLDAFDHRGLTWQDVHVVQDEFLSKFEEGRPIHVLLKCQASPHVYRLENDQKRWIKDIDTFLAEGHAWEDVRYVTCDYLRSLPDGAAIPEDAGPPPQP